MRKFGIGFVFLAFAVAASAQQALQCANPDVLNALVFNARSESRLVIKPSLPTGVAGFGAPADFKLIGSGVRGQNLFTVVAYKTQLDTGKAFDSLLGYLFDQGWKREADQPAQQPLVTVAGPQPTRAQLCRNGDRRGVTVRDIDGVRYVSISGSETNPPRACDVPLPQPGAANFNPMTQINALQAQMPRFSLPATARMSPSPNPGFANAGGGVNTTSTSLRIESPDSAASLARHLARQLTEQGWRGDAEWSGALSTGSTWTRKAADGKPYWGMLEIQSVGGAVYEIGFSLTSQPQR